MAILLLIIFTVMGLASLLLIRNHIVLHVRLKAIDAIYDKYDWKNQKHLLETPNYNAMLFDLTKWTFKQFYPTLAKE